MVNPYDVMYPQGVRGARNIVLPNVYARDLTINDFWSAVTRARQYSDFTGLDRMYGYVFKTSTVVRAALSKRLTPLKTRKFDVYLNGKRNEILSDKLMSTPFVRELIYERGMANFTYAKVIGVYPNGETYSYPLRNLDFVNRAVKARTFDVEGQWKVNDHYNLFWLQTNETSDDQMGIMEPICRDLINALGTQNAWQTAALFLAYPQLMLYYENVDNKDVLGADGKPINMYEAARQAAHSIGLGEIIISGKNTSDDGKEVLKDLELEYVNGNSTADTFRIFKENIDGLYENIAVLTLGSSLLLRSAKNTNSERLVRAHLMGYYDLCERDVQDAQDWLNVQENKEKLAYLLDMPELVDAVIKARPDSHIDIGDVEIYTQFLDKTGLRPTDDLIRKIGLDVTDVVGYEESKNAVARSKELVAMDRENVASGSGGEVASGGGNGVS